MKELKDLRRKLRRLAGMADLPESWSTDQTDGYLRQHYNIDMSSAEIAAGLNVGRKVRITKNQVIRRAQTLKLNRKGKART
jgi:predicted DNA-binding protein YlxM (UPF0122 family)